MKTSIELGDRIEHFLVDLDGTLLGNHGLALSTDFVVKVVRTLSRKIGLKAAVATLLAVKDELAGAPAFADSDLRSNQLPNDIRVLRRFANSVGMEIEEARSFVREALGTIFPSLQKHFYPIEGAKDFLNWASKRFPLTLATNPVWPIEVIEMRVRWAGLDPAIFQGITHIRKMHWVKPDVRYYTEIVDDLGLKPEQCLLIGNEIKMDLPASRVGIRVYIVDPKTSKAVGLTSGGKLIALKGARAWKGSYSHLKSALDAQADSIGGFPLLK